MGSEGLSSATFPPQPGDAPESRLLDVPQASTTEDFSDWHPSCPPFPPCRLPEHATEEGTPWAGWDGRGDLWARS